MRYPKLLPSRPHAHPGLLGALVLGCALVVAFTFTATPDPAVLTPRPLRTLVGHSAAVTALGFSPEGTLLASASRDGTVRLWDTASGRVVRVLRQGSLRAGSAPNPVGVALSRMGRIVVLVDASGVVDAWESATGRRLPRGPAVHDPPPTALALAPSGARAAVAHAGGGVVLWEPVTGRGVRVLAADDGLSWALAFAPNGRLLAAGGLNRPLRTWRLDAGLKQDASAAGAAVEAIAFSPDGRIVATGGTSGPALWDAATGALLKAMPGGQTRAVAFTPDGAMVATADAGGWVRWWELSSGRQVRAARLPGPIGIVAMAPEQTVATVDVEVDAADFPATTGPDVHLWLAR